MSYDISFRVKVEGVDRHVEVGNCDANITWNVREIITRSTGLPWINEENNGLVKDIIPSIESGLCELTRHPTKYVPYESPNGWGTVDGVKRFFMRILDAWHQLEEEDEKLASVATFWITWREEDRYVPTTRDNSSQPVGVCME